MLLCKGNFEQVSIVLGFFWNEKFLDALIENFSLHEKIFVVVEAKAGHFLSFNVAKSL